MTADELRTFDRVVRQRDEARAALDALYTWAEGCASRFPPAPLVEQIDRALSKTRNAEPERMAA